MQEVKKFKGFPNPGYRKSYKTLTESFPARYYGETEERWKKTYREGIWAKKIENLQFMQAQKTEK